ncbi:MAG: hypothetical protein IT530_12965 [Burkholderiales bacterium]|nr:hypothetical protein [Burkholderiales bacterium]
MDRIDRSAFSVVSLADLGDDRAHWRSVSPTERLQAVERLRRINYGYDPAQRLQRILEVAEFKPR